jgi:nitrogen fixation NifU-like protein
MSFDDLAREHILEHYRHPHGRGTLEHPDLVAEDANPLCGDRLRMEFRLGGDRIEAVRFSGEGCSISQASASMLCERIEGLPLEQARAIGRDDVLEMIGLELGPVRLKCALLALKTMKVGLWGLGAAADLDDDA